MGLQLRKIMFHSQHEVESPSALAILLWLVEVG
jgi:hypothetical protein